MRYARIENEAVVEFIDFDPTDKFHPSLVWISCDETVEIGWSYVDGVFSEPAGEV